MTKNSQSINMFIYSMQIIIEQYEDNIYGYGKVD